MQVILQKNTQGINIIPLSGRFAGQVVAEAEQVFTEERMPLKRRYGVPVTVRRVWGLVVRDDNIHHDRETLRALSLGGLPC